MTSPPDRRDDLSYDREEALAALQEARRALKPTSRLRFFGVTRRQLDRIYENERRAIEKHFAANSERRVSQSQEAGRPGTPDSHEPTQPRPRPSVTAAGTQRLQELLQKANSALRSDDYRVLSNLFRDWGRTANEVRNSLGEATGGEERELLYKELSASIVMTDRAKGLLITEPSDSEELLRLAGPALGKMTRCVGLTRSRLLEAAR